MNKFVFTCGDINGIGPEIVIKTINKINKQKNITIYFLCPANVFNQASKTTKPLFNFKVIKRISEAKRSGIFVIDFGTYKQNLGKPTKSSGAAAFKAIKISFRILRDQKADAVITAPISKTAINKAKINFPGHTEMYAEWSEAKDFVMTFLSDKMYAGLVTIHEPIKNVAKLITAKRLKDKIETILNTLKIDLKISSPKIAVLGLNPHAGENGVIGKEETEIIQPVIMNKKFSQYLSGPFSPDAFFANHLYKKFDLVLGMYHDQALIPFKLLNFGGGVNYTAGLPIVRTSPDHGVAYDIAGKNLADESSILLAFRYAQKIVENRKTYAAV
jgi:4-hydroxythreonine-4-phosphate dehydrogenase